MGWIKELNILKIGKVGEKNEKNDLVVLEMICRTIHKYTYSHDLHLFGSLAIPTNEDSHKN